jgi:hypothetical protein
MAGREWIDLTGRLGKNENIVRSKLDKAADPDASQSSRDDFYARDGAHNGGSAQACNFIAFR